MLQTGKSKGKAPVARHLFVRVHRGQEYWAIVGEGAGEYGIRWNQREKYIDTSSLAGFKRP